MIEGNDLYTLTEIARKDDVVTYDLFFGPNHPGMHGNFGYVLDMVGTTVVDIKLNAGQLHRAFEKLMEQKKWIQNVALVPRICVPDPDPNEVAYCTAVEKLAGIKVPKRADYLRTITLEMSRLSSLLFGMGGLGGALGLYSAMYLLTLDRDYLLDLFEWLTGARVYHIYNIPGGVRRDIPDDAWIKKLEDTLNYLESRLPDYDNLIFENPVVHDRLKGIGKITTEEAIRYGIVGPNLRSTGFQADVRIDDPYAAYDELDVPRITQSSSDALSRAVQVRMEFEATIGLVRQALKQLPKGKFKTDIGNPLHFTVPPGEVYSKVESSKGEFGYYVVSDGGEKPHRVGVRGPSFAAGLALAREQLKGMKIDDIAMWMASFAICPPDFDK